MIKLGPYLWKRGEKKKKKETLVDLVGFKIYRSKIKNLARHWWSEGWDPRGTSKHTHICAHRRPELAKTFCAAGFGSEPMLAKKRSIPCGAYLAFSRDHSLIIQNFVSCTVLSVSRTFKQNKTYQPYHTKTKLHTTLFLISCINLEAVRYKNGHTKRQMTWNIITLAFLIHTIFPLRVKAWNILKDSCKMIWSRWSQRKKKTPKHKHTWSIKHRPDVSKRKKEK